VAVKIRMKRFGRKHRSFFRICATESRAPRDGRVIEELGTYDPSIVDTDARTVMNGERVKYWLSVGAKPSERVHTLIKKYGPEGTHVKQQQAAIEKLKAPKAIPDAGAPAFVLKPKEKAPPAGAAPPAAAEAPAPEAAAPEAPSPAAEAPAAESKAAE
jgi:small subunit ribosomal protein S16